MNYEQWSKYYSEHLMPPLFPDFSSSLDWLFKPPLTNQGPMKRGQPQEPAGNQGGQINVPKVPEIGKQIEDAVNHILAGIFTKEHVRDGAVYGGAALLLFVVVWSALK